MNPIATVRRLRSRPSPDPRPRRRSQSPSGSTGVREQRPARALDQREAVVGGGLALTIGPDRRITLHELAPGQARQIGSFSSAADAWRAIDAIDLADDIELAA